jgi:hypothetical protein
VGRRPPTFGGWTSPMAGVGDTWVEEGAREGAARATGGEVGEGGGATLLPASGPPPVREGRWRPRVGRSASARSTTVGTCTSPPPKLARVRRMQGARRRERGGRKEGERELERPEGPDWRPERGECRGSLPPSSKFVSDRVADSNG